MKTDFKNLIVMGHSSCSESENVLCTHCGSRIKLVTHAWDPETGKNHLLGMTCAKRIGLNPELIDRRLSQSQLDVINSFREEKRQIDETLAAEVEKRSQLEFEARRPYIDLLLKQETGFHNSLAEQLKSGALSIRQAEFVAKLVSATGRRNKANAEQWDRAIEICSIWEDGWYDDYYSRKRAIESDFFARRDAALRNNK